MPYLNQLSFYFKVSLGFVLVFFKITFNKGGGRSWEDLGKKQDNFSTFKLFHTDVRFSWLANKIKTNKLHSNLTIITAFTNKGSRSFHLDVDFFFSFMGVEVSFFLKKKHISATLFYFHAKNLLGMIDFFSKCSCSCQHLKADYETSEPWSERISNRHVQFLG